MKTRIKETTNTEDGIVKVVYQAQFQDFWRWWGWKPVLDYHVYHNSRTNDWHVPYEDELFKSDSERGTLQFCKDLIDYILKIEKQNKEYDERLKQVKKSAKVKYIRYP